eukprot:10572_1
MSDSILNNVWLSIIIMWVNFIALLAILIYHTYQLCHVQKDLKGSPIKVFGIISFKHLSFMVIIISFIPSLSMTIIYTPQQSFPDAICRISTPMFIVCFAVSKLALHLFVTVRSQVARLTTNRLYTIGLILILSDVLFIIYVLSGIPTIMSAQKDVLCEVIEVSLSVYLWFAINDFVIGTYCLLAFILPLKKYVWLEQQSPAFDSELQHLANRIMIFSGIALVSTMVFIVASSILSDPGLFVVIDATINALCAVLQFKHCKSVPCMCVPSLQVKSSQELKSSVSQMDQQSTTSTNKVAVIIHDE